MFDFVTGRAQSCDGVSRRDFLRVGGLAALGLSLSGFLKLQHAAAVAAAGHYTIDGRSRRLAAV